MSISYPPFSGAYRKLGSNPVRDIHAFCTAGAFADAGNRCRHHPDTRTPLPLEQQHRSLPEPRVDGIAEPASAGEPDRGLVVAVDDADLPLAAKHPVAPRHHGGDDLGRKALPLHVGRHRPAAFGKPVDRRRHAPKNLMIAGLADEMAARLLLDRPETIAEHRPGAGMPEKTDPALFPRPRIAADEPRHLRRRPHFCIGVEVAGPVRAQDGALGLDRRDFYDGGSRHGNLLDATRGP